MKYGSCDISPRVTICSTCEQRAACSVQRAVPSHSVARHSYALFVFFLPCADSCSTPPARWIARRTFDKSIVSSASLRSRSRLCAARGAVVRRTSHGGAVRRLQIAGAAATDISRAVPRPGSRGRESTATTIHKIAATHRSTCSFWDEAGPAEPGLLPTMPEMPRRPWLRVLCRSTCTDGQNQVGRHLLGRHKGRRRGARARGGGARVRESTVGSKSMGGAPRSMVGACGGAGGVGGGSGSSLLRLARAGHSPSRMWLLVPACL